MAKRIARSEIKKVDELYHRDDEVYLSEGRAINRDDALTKISIEKEKYDQFSNIIRSLNRYADNLELLYEKAFALIYPVSEPPALHIDISTLNQRLNELELNEELTPEISKLYQIYKEAYLNKPSAEELKPLMPIEEEEQATALRIAFRYEHKKPEIIIKKKKL